jgi:Ca2+:H+ antiporter
VGRKLYWASFALTPAVLVARFWAGTGETFLFVLAAAALTPLAFLIGEATENVAEHTGPGIGGFLNASFGNAPELIIALFAIGDSLPNVVRGSIAGSVVSTSLLVLGAAMIFGGNGEIDRRSLLLQLGMVGAAVVLFLIPSIGGWHGSPDRHGLYLLTLPVAAALLVLYVVLTGKNLRVHHAAHETEPGAAAGAWSLRLAVAALAAGTVATAFDSEVLVHSLDAFGRALGLSQFFVAVVIVAIVGNAAEHGGAIVVARRGSPRLGAEIAISSAAQVGVFVAPTIALLSGLIGRGLPLSFRPVELGAMAASTAVVAVTVLDGRSRRWEGFLLSGLYVAAVVAFALSGDR